MRQPRPALRLTTLAAASGLLFASAAVHAQTAAAPPAGAASGAQQLETVVVTGIRRSLESSVDLKRNAHGVVDGIVAISWSRLTLHGVQDHAGPTPMRIRHDALVAAADVVAGVRSIARELGGDVVSTVGILTVAAHAVGLVDDRAATDGGRVFPAERVLRLAQLVIGGAERGPAGVRAVGRLPYAKGIARRVRMLRKCTRVCLLVFRARCHGQGLRSAAPTNGREQRERHQPLADTLHLRSIHRTRSPM